MNELLKRISDFGIVPVVKIDRAEDALPLAKALSDGCLPLAEITFRTQAAEASIAAISAAMPDMLVGAGTVLTVEQVDRAVAAGAKFVVSPGFNPKVVERCIAIGVPVAPGCSGTSDMEAAMELGLDVVKFFPAEASGGVEFLKAVSGPYPNLKFMPTGGVNAENLNDYLSLKNVIACGGTWMVKPELIAAGDFAGIAALTRQAVNNMLGFGLAHVGINTPDEARAAGVARSYSDLFGLAYREGKSSIFGGDIVEALRQPGRGAHGHVAIRTKYPPARRRPLQAPRRGLRRKFRQVRRQGQAHGHLFRRRARRLRHPPDPGLGRKPRPRLLQQQALPPRAPWPPRRGAFRPIAVGARRPPAPQPFPKACLWACFFCPPRADHFN